MRVLVNGSLGTFQQQRNLRILLERLLGAFWALLRTCFINPRNQKLPISSRVRVDIASTQRHLRKPGAMPMPCIRWQDR